MECLWLRWGSIKEAFFFVLCTCLCLVWQCGDIALSSDFVLNFQQQVGGLDLPYTHSQLITNNQWFSRAKSVVHCPCGLGLSLTWSFVASYCPTCYFFPLLSQSLLAFFRKLVIFLTLKNCCSCLQLGTSITSAPGCCLPTLFCQSDPSRSNRAHSSCPH